MQSTPIPQPAVRDDAEPGSPPTTFEPAFDPAGSPAEIAAAATAAALSLGSRVLRRPLTAAAVADGPAGTGAAERAAVAEVETIVAATQAALANLGHYDHLTRLPNRQRFMADMARRTAGDPPGLLVLITLAEARQFNEILRALGHACSEEFIQTGARRIRDAVPAALTVYHVSVLSFAFVVPFEGRDIAPAVVPDLAGRLREPVVTREVPVTCQPGIGLSPLPPPPASVAETLRAALTAAQDSRYRDDQPWSFYDRSTDAAHQRAFTLLADLGRAIATGDGLTLAFQPKVDLATGRACGGEALLRWTHGSFGVVSPAEFIPLAEATALIGPLTRWVGEETVRQTAAWVGRGLDLPIAMNVSPANLHGSDFARSIQDQTQRHGLAPEHLEIEITEGMALSGDAEVVRQLDRLRDMGFTIAIDDFGTGYSNIGHLTRMPATVLKIDQSFVRPMDDDERRQVLVRTVIAMAKAIGYSVVAEGIETRATYDRLAGWGCDAGQGYLMSRPLAPDAFEAFVRLHA